MRTPSSRPRDGDDRGSSTPAVSPRTGALSVRDHRICCRGCRWCSACLAGGAVEAGGRREARRGGGGGRPPPGDRGTAPADAGGHLSPALRMVPARGEIPAEEQLRWVTARL